MTNSAWVARVFNVGFGLAAAGFAVRCAYLCFSPRNILVFDRKRNAVRRGKRLVGNLDQIAAIQVCPSSATSHLKVLFGNDTSIPVGGVRVVGADEANRLADEIARFLGIRKDNLELSPEYLEARCQDDRMTILNATPVWKLAIRTLAKFPATAPGVVLLFMGIRYLLSSTDPLAWWIVWAGALITVVTLFVIGFDFVRQLNRRNEILVLDRKHGDLRNNRRVIAPLRDIREVVLQEDAKANDEPQGCSLALALQGGKMIRIGPKQTDQTATQHLASIIANFLRVEVRRSDRQ